MHHPEELPMTRCPTAPQSEEQGKAKTTAWNNRFLNGSEEPRRAVVGVFSLFLVLFCRWEVMLESLLGKQRDVMGHLGYRKGWWSNWALKCIFSIMTFACPCSHDCNATWPKTSWSKCELIYLPVKHKSNFSVFMFSLKAKPCGSLPRIRIKTISDVSRTHFPIPCSWRVAPHIWWLAISVYKPSCKTDGWISLHHSGPNTHLSLCPSFHILPKMMLVVMRQ